jgi:hypothetical protein
MYAVGTCTGKIRCWKRWPQPTSVALAFGKTKAIRLLEILQVRTISVPDSGLQPSPKPTWITSPLKPVLRFDKKAKEEAGNLTLMLEQLF